MNTHQRQQEMDDMLRSCKYCGRTHPREYICPKKPKPVFRKNRGAKEKYRSTSAWQKLRDSVAARDGWLCQLCLEEGRYCGHIEVHHIVPMAVDYTQRAERLNLITLCPMHHRMADAGEIPAEKLKIIAERNEKLDEY